MEFKTLKIRTGAQVMNCWLNRPEKRNALDAEMLGELIDLFGKVGEDRQVRVLVLRAEGEVFSAGADLSLLSEISGKSRIGLEDEAGLFFDCYNSLYRLPLPTICYVHGGVHGGANGLAAACDFTIAGRGTVFSFREVGLGLVPATVAPFVMNRTGTRNARRMMLWGQAFGAAEALETGLVDAICEPGEAGNKIDELCGQVLKNAPDAVSETKKHLLALEDPSLMADLKKSCTGLMARTRLSAEAFEGISAFFEKREPSWRKIGPGNDRRGKPSPDGDQ